MSTIPIDAEIRQRARTSFEPEDLGTVADEPTDEDGLTWRTLADIPDTPQADLWLGMFEEDSTMIYAKGDTGKTRTCSYVVREAVNEGIRPLIYDAEQRARSWRRAVEGLGVDLTSVIYRNPTDLPSSLLGRPLSQVIPHLARVARAADAGMLIIDSLMAAANMDEAGMRGDVVEPYNVARSLGDIGFRSIVVGHPTKANPDGDPYGSVAWYNAARLIWHGSKAEGEGHRVRWVARKKNDRGAIDNVLLSFHYDERGILRDATRENDEQATSDWLTTALIEGPRTVEDMAEDLADEDDGPYTVALDRSKNRVRQTLGRMKRKGLVHKVSSKRGSPWALGSPERRNGKG